MNPWNLKWALQQLVGRDLHNFHKSIKQTTKEIKRKEKAQSSQKCRKKPENSNTNLCGILFFLQDRFIQSTIENTIISDSYTHYPNCNNRMRSQCVISRPAFSPTTVVSIIRHNINLIAAISAIECTNFMHHFGSRILLF